MKQQKLTILLYSENTIHFLIRKPFKLTMLRFRAFQVALVVRNVPANEGDIRDTGSIPGLERSLEKEMATHSSLLAWRIPRSEKPRRLQSIGSEESNMTEAT